MARIYLDLETYRPKKENAFIEEKVVSAGLLIDRTAYNERSLKTPMAPTLISEWHGLNECQIVSNVLAKVKETIKAEKANNYVTVLTGYGVLRFDIPLLVSRCVQNSLDNLDQATKMWHDCITIDYAQQLLAANGNKFKGATLDNVIATATRLGLNPPAHNGDGASMRELYPAQKYSDIEKHLVEDLNAIRWLDLYGAKKLVEISVKQGKALFAE